MKAAQALTVYGINKESSLGFPPLSEVLKKAGATNTESIGGQLQI